MSRILATNGTSERLMGTEELKQNPNWWPVGGQAKEAAQVASKPKGVTPKEVRTPAAVEEQPKAVTVEAAEEVAEVAEEATEETAQVAEPAKPVVETVVPPVQVGKAIPQMVKAIKEATTVAQVEALIAGDDRDTIKKVAQQRIKALSK
jgi:hypothetical protein